MPYGAFAQCPECPRGWWRTIAAFAYNLALPVYYPSFQAGLCGLRVRSDHWCGNEFIEVASCIYPVFLSQVVRQNSAGSKLRLQSAATAVDQYDRFGLVYHWDDPLQPLHAHWISYSTPAYSLIVDHATGLQYPIPGSPWDDYLIPEDWYAWTTGRGNAEYIYLRARLAAQAYGTDGCDNNHLKCRRMI